MNTINTIRLIGDIHGQYNSYFPLIHESEYSIQLGDMGFDYTTLDKSGVDWSKHKWIRGNHDNPYTCVNSPGYLGKYGTYTLNGINFFFLSGAWSIDYKYRCNMINWWGEEELNIIELEDALSFYKKVKPALVITHAPPQFICDYMSNPILLDRFNVTEQEAKSRTGFYLEEMWKYHKPKRWIFGHMHKNWEMKEETHFQCVNQLSCLDL